MLNNAITATRGFVGETVDLYKNNTGGAIGCTVVGMVIQEVVGHKVFKWTEKKVRNSMVAEAARAQFARLKGDGIDPELREQLVRTTAKVEAVTDQLNSKLDAGKAE